jgi:hypothetical protein
VKKDEWDAAHDQRDISRDDSLRNADRALEQQDLKDGNLKGAAYRNTQARIRAGNGFVPGTLRGEVRLHLAPELEGVGDHAEGLLGAPDA